MKWDANAFWWEPYLTIALVLALFVLIIRERRRWAAALAAVPRPIKLAVLGTTVAAFLFRQFCVMPAFLHDFYVGPALVATSLRFPPDTLTGYGVEYGLAGFTVLSLWATAFGRTVETIFAANNLFSALTTIPLAVVAGFWVRSPLAGLFAAAIWITSPFVCRISHSEDMHTLGMFWVLSTFALLEIGLALRSGASVAAAAITLWLAMFTRQTCYPWIVVLLAVLAERWLRARPEDRPPLHGQWRLILVGVAFMCVSVASRMHSSVDTWEFDDVLTGYRVVLSHPILLWWTLLDHPMLGLRTVSFTVPLLAFLGAFVIARRSRSPLAIFAGALGWFVFLFPTWPPRGSDWPFRFHFYVIAIIAAGAGAAWLVERIAQQSGRPLAPAAQVGAAIALAVLGLFSVATLDNRKPNPEVVEYVFMRDELIRMGQPLSVVLNVATGIASRTPDLLATHFGLPMVSPVDKYYAPANQPRPYVFLAGIACHSHSLPELLALEGTAAGVRPSEETLARFHYLARDRSTRFGLDLFPPTTMQPACANILEHATPLVEGPEVALEDAPPWSYFDVHKLRLRLMRWDPPEVG